MQHAPWPVGVALALALVVIIGLLGPLALFNPWFTSALQVRHDVAAELGTEQVEVERLTSGYLRDIYAGGSFEATREGSSEPFLDADERSHMVDVSNLVRILAVVLALALLLALGSGVVMRHEPARIGRIMLATAGAVGLAAIGLAAIFAVDFDTAFTAFHELFFPPGTWQFALGSNLITLFPQPFWFDAAILAGVSIVVVALIVTVAGFGFWRAGSRPSASA